MKKIISILAITLAAAFAANAQTEYVKVGEQCPDFTITHDNGKTIKLSDFKGKVVLINFFATWCPPCQKELAEVETVLYPKFKNNKNFVMLTIGREHSDAELAKYNTKKKFTFPLYPDKSRAIFSKFAKQTIPRTYIIDKNGKIDVIHVGFESGDTEKNIAIIEKLLAK